MARRQIRAARGAKPRAQTRRRDPFEVSLTPAQEKEITERLAEEIQNAMDARITIVGDDQLLDQWHKLYEGGDRNITKDSPWPNASNLTSWLGTEKVDAYRSRVVQTLFVNPIWIVEGWGQSAARAPFVEQFMQWKAEEGRMQTYVAKVVHMALIEGTGILEVSERPVLRKITERKRVQVVQREDGVVIVDEKGNPIPATDAQGRPIPADPTDPQQASALITIERLGRIRGGPQFRVISLKDFVILPGHVQEQSDAWGYAKRFWKRLPELRDLEERGIYKNVAALGDEGERTPSPIMVREGQDVAPQRDFTSEKELWEILFLYDFEGDGIEQWYIATLHIGKRILLRLQKDDLGQARYLIFTPFPRADFIYGYSLIGHKLETLIAEHTAWRNMITDRMKLVISPPMKRLVNGLWNPTTEPWGPFAVIPVRDMREVEAMQIPDIPGAAFQRESGVVAASERVAGLVDTALGVHPEQDRTLGEVRLVSSQSLIRVEEVVKHLQEEMENLFDLCFEMWKRALRENPEPIPSGLQAALESRGIKVDAQNLDVNMLEGTFRGKPRGSVETADMEVMRGDLNALLTTVAQLAQQGATVFGQVLNDPAVVRSVLLQAMRVFRFEDRQAFEQAIERAIQAQQQQAQQPQQGQPPVSPTQELPNEA